MQSELDSRSIAAARLVGLSLAGSTFAGAEPWIVSEETGLKQALENAPTLKTDSLLRMNPAPSSIEAGL